MSTVGQILAGAFSRRNPNVPGILTTYKELARALSDYMRELAVKVANVNPAYFGSFSTVDPDGEKWTQPDAAARVYLVERVEDDVEVNLVEARDRFEAAAPPRIYQVGRHWYSPENADVDPDPTVGLEEDPLPELESVGGTPLRFYYGVVFDELDLTGTEDELMAIELDAAWRPRHDSLLKDVLCQYMAAKDRDATDRSYWDGLVKTGEAALLAEAELENFEKHTRHTSRPRG